MRYMFISLICVYSASIFASNNEDLNISGADHINVDFMGCIWKIPEKFQSMGPSSLRFFALDEEGVSSIEFKDSYFDEKSIFSGRIKNLKREYRGEFIKYNFDYDADDDKKVISVTVFANKIQHVIFLHVFENDINFISSECL